MFLYWLNLMHLWLVKPQGGAKDHKRALGGFSSCVSLLVELDIFRCRFVLCVCPGLCKYIYCTFNVLLYVCTVLLARLFEPLSCVFLFFVVPHHKHQHSLHFSLTHTHTLELRHNSQTHTHTHPPHLHVCSQFFFALTSCLVSLQSRKASDQTKSIESKTDSIGSGRAIPIKQVRHHIHTLII